MARGLLNLGCSGASSLRNTEKNKASSEINSEANLK